MKQNRKRTALALLLALTLTACGAVSTPAKEDAGSGAYGPEESAVSMDTAPEASAPEQTPPPPQEHRAEKRIYRGTLELETTAFDQAARDLAALVETCGGYYAGSSLSDYGSGYRTGEYTIRVPVEQYRAFLDRAGELCHLRWKNEETEDVTRLYYDTEGRLKTQQTKLARLQELLAQAKTMEDIITLEAALSDTEYQIEQLSGEIRYYDDQVALSTVNVTLHEVYKLSGDQTPPEGFGDRLGRAVSNGFVSFLNAAEDGLVFLAYNLLWVVLAAAGIALVIVLRRRRRAHPGEKRPLFRKKAKQQDEQK